MRSVLGLDAAWTEHNPSGVALVDETARGWKLRALAPSYIAFEGLARGEPLDGSPSGSRPNAAALIAACHALTGEAPDIVAVDMPLSRAPVVGRRASDNMISSTYGAKGCATHSPSRDRPGAISDRFRADIEAEGYRLLTQAGETPESKGLIEVYPHPALVELTGARRRLPYKAGKTKSYWPDLPILDRKHKLLGVWAMIVAALDRRIEGVAEALIAPDLKASGVTMKAYEDRLDAIVCALVGVSALEGRARVFGDEVSAVWVPCF